MTRLHQDLIINVPGRSGLTLNLTIEPGRVWGGLAPMARVKLRCCIRWRG